MDDEDRAPVILSKKHHQLKISERIIQEAPTLALIESTSIAGKHDRQPRLVRWNAISASRIPAERIAPGFDAAIKN